MPRGRYIPEIQPERDIGWRRGWYGRVLHYYRHTNWDTLCGKGALRGHGEDPMPQRRWRHCRQCDELLRLGLEAKEDQ